MCRPARAPRSPRSPRSPGISGATRRRCGSGSGPTRHTTPARHPRVPQLAGGTETGLLAGFTLPEDAVERLARIPQQAWTPDRGDGMPLPSATSRRHRHRHQSHARTTSMMGGPDGNEAVQQRLEAGPHYRECRYPLRLRCYQNSISRRASALMSPPESLTANKLRSIFPARSNMTADDPCSSNPARSTRS